MPLTGQVGLPPGAWDTPSVRPQDPYLSCLSLCFKGENASVSETTQAWLLLNPHRVGTLLTYTESRRDLKKMPLVGGCSPTAWGVGGPFVRRNAPVALGRGRLAPEHKNWPEEGGLDFSSHSSPSRSTRSAELYAAALQSLLLAQCICVFWSPCSDCVTWTCRLNGILLVKSFQLCLTCF